MSKHDREESGQPWAATPEDVLAVLRGTATPEQRASVVEALSNPYSTVSEFVREIEKWAKKRFPLAGSSPPAKCASPPNHAKQRLDAVLAYVERKRAEGVFTQDEVAAFAKAGPGADEFAAPPISPVECNALAVRILKAIEKARPELATELVKFRADRRR